MKRRCLLSLFVALISISAVAQTTSDELPPVSCKDRIVSAIRCKGRYCDDITVGCDTVKHQIWQVKSMAFISEEGTAESACRLDSGPGKAEFAEGFITGLACKGSYCDEVSIQCASFHDAFPSVNGCHWTAWISEETGPVIFAPGTGATKIQCRGRYCDDMRFWVCPVAKP